MPAYYVTTASSVYTAIVVGNSANLSQELAKLLTANGLVADTYKWSSFKKEFRQADYYYFLLNLGKNSRNRISDLNRYDFSKRSKITVVITETPLNSSTLHNQKAIHQEAVRLINKGINIRLIYLRDLYGPQVSYSKNSVLGKLLQSGQSTIKLKSSDQDLIYPLHLDDALKGIIKATFARDSLKKIYELGGKPITLLNLAYKIRNLKQNGEFRLETKDKPDPSSAKTDAIIQLTWKELSYTPQTDLDAGLKETIKLLQLTPAPQIQTLPQADFPKTEVVVSPQPKSFSLGKEAPSELITTTEPVVAPLEKPTIVRKKFNFNYRKSLFVPLVIILVVLISLLSPVMSFAYQVWSIKRNIERLQVVVSAKEIDSVHEQIEALNHHANGLQDLINNYYQPLVFLFSSEKVNNLVQLNQLLQYLTQTGKALSEAATVGSEAFSLISGQKKGDVEHTLHLTETKITEAYHYLSLAQSLITSRPELLEIEIFGINNQLTKIKEEIPQARNLLFQMQQFLLTSPEVLGLNGRRTYLVLLQNNMELRPTGGFIGSYATMTFEDGELLDLQVEDVYTADGQLRGYVEPPEPIQRYLGEATWFLRDSNWNPDFPTTAETAAWFLDKEMNIKVDGVVGINLNVIQKFLEVMGPVDLIDYDETITAENLYERLQYQSEINFFPGSTQKKDYLSQLTKLLFQRIQHADKATLFDVAQVMVESANEKQITIALKQPQAHQVFDNLMWSGKVVKPECTLETTSCVNDYFGFREANVGVNKANYFLNRKINHQVSIKQNEIEHTVSLILENSSQSEAWPGGIYRNYLRAYVTKGSVLKSISINDAPYDLDTIDEATESDKTVWGFITNTPPGNTAQIKIVYGLPVGIGQGQLPGYQLYVQKQPGTGADAYNFSVTHDKNLQVVRTNFAPQKFTGELFSEQTLNTDKIFRIEFTR